jgi:hypothetical protein
VRSRRSLFAVLFAAALLVGPTVYTGRNARHRPPQPHRVAAGADWTPADPAGELAARGLRLHATRRIGPLRA